MGIVYRGIPEAKALELAKAHHLRYFVETGTLIGRTAAWASLRFEQVYTIELDRYFYDQSRRTYGNNGPRRNVAFYHGDSRDLLGGILGQLGEPVLVWLDAHWSKDLGYGRPELGECPVMAEIEAIKASGKKHVVLIDDARLFVGEKSWPTVEEIKASFGNGWQIAVVDDVLIAEPR